MKTKTIDLPPSSGVKKNQEKTKLISQIKPQIFIEDPNKLDSNGNPPLKSALLNNDIAKIKALLSHDLIDPNQADKEGNTLLMSIATDPELASKNEEIITLLLQHPKINLNQFNQNGNAALHIACSNNNYKLAISLINNNKTYLNLLDKKGTSPLILALEMDSIEIVKALIANPKTDLNVKDIYGSTAILWASSRGYSDIAKTLIANPKIDLNAKNYKKWTALMWASNKGHSDIAKTDLNAKDKDRRTALLWATNNGFFDITKAFITNPKTDLNIKDNDGKTALIWASSMGHSDIAKTLIANPKTDLNAKDNDGKTALIWAISLGYFDIAKALIVNKNIDVNAWDSNGRKPIHQAILKNQKDLEKLILGQEKYPQLCSFFIEQLNICQHFGIKESISLPNNKTIDTDGFEAEYVYTKLQNNLEQFIKLTSTQKITPKNFNWLSILNDFRKSPMSAKTAIAALKDPSINTLILPVGWLEHSTGIVIVKPSKTKESFKLIKANRGDRILPDIAGLKIYYINKPDQLENAITKIFELTDKEEGKDYFLNDIDIDLGLKLTGTLVHKDQSIGNCALASGKLNIRSAIYAELLRCGYPSDQAIQFSKNLYKAFTAYGRTEQIKQFIEKDKELKAYMAENKLTKQNLLEEGIIEPYEILRKIVFKCVRDRLTEGLEILLTNYPELVFEKNKEGLDIAQFALKKGQKRAHILINNKIKELNAGSKKMK